MKRASDKKVVEGGGGAVRMRSATLRDEVTEEAGHWLVAGPSGIRHRARGHRQSAAVHGHASYTHT